MYWLLLPPTPQDDERAPEEQQQQRTTIDVRAVLALLQSLVRFSAVTTLKRRP